MGKLGLTLAVLFLSFMAGDLSNLTILLPSESDDATAVPVSEMQPPADEIRPAGLSEEVTTVTFRPADHMLDGPPKFPVSFRFPFRHHKRPRHHRSFGGPSKPLDLPDAEISYGNDMILGAAKVSDEDGSDDLTFSGFRHHLPRRHDHDMPDAEKEDRNDASDSDSDSDDEHDHGTKRFHHGHRHSEMKDDEDHDHHYYHHHEHYHHHHEDKEEEEEEKGGFLSYFRKILMDPF